MEPRLCSPVEGFGLFLTPGESHCGGWETEAGAALIHQLSCVTMLKRDGARTGKDEERLQPLPGKFRRRVAGLLPGKLLAGVPVLSHLLTLTPADVCASPGVGVSPGGTESPRVLPAGG